MLDEVGLSSGGRGGGSDRCVGGVAVAGCGMPGTRHVLPRANVYSALAGSGGMEGSCIGMSRSGWWPEVGCWSGSRESTGGRQGQFGVRREVLLMDWSLVITC